MLTKSANQFSKSEDSAPENQRATKNLLEDCWRYNWKQRNDGTEKELAFL
jgi:hypothetical protein